MEITEEYILTYPNLIKQVLACWKNNDIKLLLQLDPTYQDIVENGDIDETLLEKRIEHNIGNYLFRKMMFNKEKANKKNHKSLNNLIKNLNSRFGDNYCGKEFIPVDDVEEYKIINDLSNIIIKDV